MAGVSWIKITTDMFDNPKIKYLRTLPAGNEILLVWVMLLTMAGRCNAGGMIFLIENIPYTPEMLADELRFDSKTVELAIAALTQLNMIQSLDSGLLITGWSEHQNTDGLERIREQTRQRNIAYRERKKICDVTRDVTVTSRDAIEEDKEKEKNKDIDIKRVKHKHGVYKNVLLTDAELETVKNEFPQDWQKRIETVSEYCAAFGKTYKNYVAVIRRWAKEDLKKPNRIVTAAEADANRNITVNVDDLKRNLEKV